MYSRIVLLVISLAIVGVAIFALNTVSKIVAIGGDSYRWEFGPPLVLLIFGIGLSAYWGFRILAKSKRDGG